MLTLITLALTVVFTCAAIDAFIKVKEFIMSLFEDLTAAVQGLVELSSAKFAEVSVKLEAIHAKVNALQKALDAGTPITAEQVASVLASIDAAKSAVSSSADSVAAKAEEIIADEEA